MKAPLPPVRPPALSVLRAFEATVRLGTVRAAAEELRLTDGAVSRSLRELEALVASDLFVRGNRSIRATPAAERLAMDVRDALDRLGVALTRTRDAARAQARPLVLSCEPTLLMRWLIPRLPDLQAILGADQDIRLVSAGGAVAFARDGIDLAVRRADFPISAGVRAEPFLEERVGPVCKGSMAPPMDRDAPLRGVILHTATRPDAWAQWAAQARVSLAPSREIWFEHFYQSLQAAVAGAGLAIGPIALVADDLAAGALVAPHGLIADGTRYVLMATEGRETDVRFDAVLAWLRAAVAPACELA